MGFSGDFPTAGSFAGNVFSESPRDRRFKSGFMQLPQGLEANSLCRMGRESGEAQGIFCRRQRIFETSQRILAAAQDGQPLAGASNVLAKSVNIPLRLVPKTTNSNPAIMMVSAQRDAIGFHLQARLCKSDQEGTP
jgi:hypothetical protein